MFERKTVLRRSANEYAGGGSGASWYDGRQLTTVYCTARHSHGGGVGCIPLRMSSSTTMRCTMTPGNPHCGWRTVSQHARRQDRRVDLPSDGVWGAVHGGAHHLRIRSKQVTHHREYLKNVRDERTDHRNVGNRKGVHPFAGSTVSAQLPFRLQGQVRVQNSKKDGNVRDERRECAFKSRTKVASCPNALTSETSGYEKLVDRRPFGSSGDPTPFWVDGGVRIQKTERKSRAVPTRSPPKRRWSEGSQKAEP